MKITNLTSQWYTTYFVSNALKNFLEDQGYRILEETEETPSNCDDIIIASKIFGKEIIEIRGTIASVVTSKEETEGSKRLKLLTDAMSWLSDILLSPITFFASHYNDDKNRSLCLPDLEQYRELLIKVKDYFITNNLSLKVYLVNLNGGVRIVYLNNTNNNEEEEPAEE